MSILNFLLLGIVFPAAVFCCKEEEESASDQAVILDLVEKRVTLNRRYTALIQYAVKTMDIEERESPDTEIKFRIMDEKGLAAALYERYTAIELNMTSWLCWLYYMYGKKYTFDIANQKEEQEKAEKCANVAKFMSWYNQKLAAKLFVDAYEERAGDEDEDQEDKKEDALVSLIAGATVLDTLLQRLKEINAHFEEIFAQPQTHEQHLEDTLIGYADSKEDFLRDMYGRLWAKLGSEYITVFNIMWIFLDHPQLVDPHGQKIPTLEQIKIKWHEIQKMDILETKFSYVKEILSLEDTLYRAELVTSKLSEPENLGEREWKIEKIHKDTEIKWVFKFTKP